MSIIINPIDNHREREKGVLVYPVYSRRSQGLSIGINLYPDIKLCPFNCIYCAIYPFSNNILFSLPKMENDLVKTILSAQEEDIPIKDICFSGNGEPTLSENFPAVIKRAEEIRKTMSPSSELVIITNGAGLLYSNIFSLLKNAADNPAINIWLKLDAGTQSWYEKINRSKIPFNELIKKIKEFVSVAPVTIQTMLCAIDGNPPPPAEDNAWVKLLKELTETDNIRKVQLYGKARSAPEDPKASELPEDDLNWRADSLESALRYTRTIIPVEVYL